MEDFPRSFTEYRTRFAAALDHLTPADTLTIMRALLTDDVCDLDSVAPYLFGAVESQAFINQRDPARKAVQL